MEQRILMVEELLFWWGSFWTSAVAPAYCTPPSVEFSAHQPTNGALEGNSSSKHLTSFLFGPGKLFSRRSIRDSAIGQVEIETCDQM
jgi:hypothetical protein